MAQAAKTFGAQHYDRYAFLLSISDRLGGIGLEHHRSSENGVPLGYFTKWDEGPGRRDLLPQLETLRAEQNAANGAIAQAKKAAKASEGDAK